MARHDVYDADGTLLSSSEIEDPQPVLTPADVDNLPPETLDALKTALGLA